MYSSVLTAEKPHPHPPAPLPIHPSHGQIPCLLSKRLALLTRPIKQHDGFEWPLECILSHQLTNLSRPITATFLVL